MCVLPFFFFSFAPKSEKRVGNVRKNMKMHILTSECSVKHLFTGRNLPHPSFSNNDSKKLLTCIYRVGNSKLTNCFCKIFYFCFLLLCCCCCHFNHFRRAGVCYNLENPQRQLGITTAIHQM